MLKKIVIVIMIVLVGVMIGMFYFLHSVQKQNQQYKAYLSQYLSNEIGGMYSRLKYTDNIWNKIITSKTINKDQISILSSSYSSFLNAQVETEQLATHLNIDYGNQLKQLKQDYNFNNSVINISVHFLGRINSNNLKNRYSTTLDDNDMKVIKAIYSMDESWLPIMKHYQFNNIKDKTVENHYWLDMWNQLDKVTNEKRDLKDVIR